MALAIDPVIGPLVGAILGFAWGLASDRIAARWPAHEDGAVRPVDWRTPVVALAGAAAGAFVVDRFAADPPGLAFLSVAIVVLVLLFATDLDQRLLPDVLTLPLIPYALVGFATGAGPFVATPGDLAVAAVVAVVVPLGLYLLSIPFGAGAIGMGDLKLLVGVGLMTGAYRTVVGLVSGALLAAIVIVVLLAARRISLKTYVPYGPFLILGAVWAIVGRAG